MLKNQTSQPGLRRACLLILCAVALQACTVSGVGFLNNSWDGEIEPYTYPLKVQSGSIITVVSGDTLYSIARDHQIDFQALVAANGLKPPYDVMPGQSLKVPVANVHIVTKGETIFSLSALYKMETMTLAAMNDIEEPYDLTVGQTLLLPPTMKSKSVVAQTAGKAAVPKGSGWRLPSRSEKKLKVVNNSRGKKTKSVARSTPRGGGKFLWPAHGTIISTFGGKGGGKRNDGINIAMPSGTEILAASDGTVTYVGNEVKGFGQMVLIRHRSEWVTLYAHIGKVWVEKGEAVKRGQHIANAGQSGEAAEPQLHFELRRGKESYDPEKYLNMR
jgi:murein DD-endopeptidase MepM/ murein hydrolase activator NlpD